MANVCSYHQNRNCLICAALDAACREDAGVGCLTPGTTARLMANVQAVEDMIARFDAAVFAGTIVEPADDTAAAA